MSKKLILIFIALFVVLFNASAVSSGTIKGVVKYSGVKRSPAIVYIVKAGKKFSPKTAKMNQRKKRFIPKVLPVLVGSKVVFLNSDNFEHNVFSPEGKYNLGKWKKGSKSYKFKRAGVYTQLCKLHPEMLGYVVVISNPYYGKTDKKGYFTIKNVPPGTYKLKVWHERLRGKKLKKTYNVKVSGKITKITIIP
jgi:plastocyanin